MSALFYTLEKLRRKVEREADHQTLEDTGTNKINFGLNPRLFDTALNEKGSNFLFL